MNSNVYMMQVPEYWKTYVDEVDQEREMWLNSFYKAPLRLPMPAELEYWWEKGMCSSLCPTYLPYIIIVLKEIRITMSGVKVLFSELNLFRVFQAMVGLGNW